MPCHHKEYEIVEEYHHNDETLLGPHFLCWFWKLSHLTRDLSQAEKKINVVTSWANAQNDINFTQVVILSEAETLAEMIG